MKRCWPLLTLFLCYSLLLNSVEAVPLNFPAPIARQLLEVLPELLRAKITTFDSRDDEIILEIPLDVIPEVLPMAAPFFAAIRLASLQKPVESLSEYAEVSEAVNIYSEYKEKIYLHNSAHPLSSKQVLFLADGRGDKDSPFSLALDLKERKLPLTLVRSDLSITSISEEDHFWQYPVDHALPFPFPRHWKFDTITMKRGLCFCHADGGAEAQADIAAGEERTDGSLGMACGGIPSTVEGGVGFLKEVSQWLNCANPRARAYLQGFSGLKAKKTMVFWQKVQEEFALDPLVKVKVQIVENPPGFFYALLLSPCPIK